MNEQAEVFPVGEFIEDELEARGWQRADLAKFMQYPLVFVNAMINGRTKITVTVAEKLARAFGTTPNLWLNLDKTYRSYSEQTKGA